MLATFLDPTAFAIVGGGTVVATVLRTPARELVRAGGALATLPRRRFSADPLLRQIAAQARIARGHGVMQLDRAVIRDADIAVAIEAIVDGAQPDAVAALVDYRRRARAERHAAAADVWSGAADAAPAMGMVGTLIGLATMFATMTDAQAIGGAMAVALLATLYGALIGNFVAAPIAARLRAAARAEAFERGRLIAPLAELARQEQPRPKSASNSTLDLAA